MNLHTSAFGYLSPVSAMPVSSQLGKAVSLILGLIPKELHPSLWPKYPSLCQYREYDEGLKEKEPDSASPSS